MAIDPAITKPGADKHWSLSKLISKSMHANLGQTTGTIAMKLGWNECYSHRSCIKKFGEDCSCHHCQISRWLPTEQAPSHKQWPPRPRLSSLKPKKRPTFCWRNVQMQSIQRWCCILTKFMLVIKYTWIFFQVLTCLFFIQEQIYFRRRHVNANLIIDFSLMSDKACVAQKTSTWFPYNLQEMIICT